VRSSQKVVRARSLEGTLHKCNLTSFFIGTFLMWNCILYCIYSFL